MQRLVKVAMMLMVWLTFKSLTCFKKKSVFDFLVDESALIETILGPVNQNPRWTTRPVRKHKTPVTVEIYLSILQLTAVVSDS